MHDTTKAKPVYQNLQLIGYILQMTDELWLPLNKKGENYTGPTYEKDATDIVTQFAATQTVEQL